MNTVEGNAEVPVVAEDAVVAAVPPQAIGKLQRESYHNMSDLTLRGAESFETKGSNDADEQIEKKQQQRSTPQLQRSETDDAEAAAQDDEIKQAMAMALAIQNNPHLKPDEIHELLGQRPPPTIATAPSQQQQQQHNGKHHSHHTNNKGGATRLSQIFSGGGGGAGMDDTASSHGKSNKYRANLTQIADRARGRINEMILSTKSEDGTEQQRGGGALPSSSSSGGGGGGDDQSEAAQSNTTTSVSALLFSKTEKPKSNLTLTTTLGVAWKRRGGLAKFSSSSPWERRHFYIADHKHLVYCTLDQNTDESTTPRGVLNLAESTVYASYGHTSGAPSPFCISVAAAGETKWKLSLDRHKDQLAWLQRLTAITVQSSVDQYNALLVASADPQDTTITTIPFEVATTYCHPPDSPSGMAAPPASSKSKQLWEVVRDDDDDDAAAVAPADGATMVVVPTEDDHTEERALAVRTAGRVWMYPEPQWIAVVFNVGLVLARAVVSVTSFWYVVVLGNFALVWLAVEQVPWQGLLPFVRARTEEPQVKNSNNTTKTGEEDTSTSGVPAYIPTAGSSAIQLAESTAPPVNAAGDHFAGWCSVPGSGLKVRSSGYSTSKMKIESPGQLYDCVAVDVFESPQRYPDMATRVQLPSTTYTDDPVPKTWRSPDIFIVSIALPTDPPKMGKSSSDGGGYTVTMYYKMREDTRQLLKAITGDGPVPDDLALDPRCNAVRLWEEWIRRAPVDPKFCSRFKVVPNAHNLAEIGMPSWISKYNGKPFLIKRPGVTGFLHTHPELSCVEFDVSLHPFPYLAKQGICFMKDSYFKKILVTFGFVIEGRSDDELPECVIGSMQLCYPDPKYAIQAKDFFAGTAPKSNDNDDDNDKSKEDNSPPPPS